MIKTTVSNQFKMWTKNEIGLLKIWKKEKKRRKSNQRKQGGELQLLESLLISGREIRVDHSNCKSSGIPNFNNIRIRDTHVLSCDGGYQWSHAFTLHTARVMPAFASARAPRGLVHCHLWSGPDLNQKFYNNISPKASSVCYTFRPQLRVPDGRWRRMKCEPCSALVRS